MFYCSQVFKFTKLGDTSPSLTLGIAFKPGSGFGHFCQPTSVAVETSGVFYVADGLVVYATCIVCEL